MIRYCSAWTLFILGDIVSRVMNLPYMGWLYPLYNKLMIKSDTIQGGSDRGPWTEIDE